MVTETIKEEPVGAGAEATSKKAAKKAAKDAEKAAKVGNGWRCWLTLLEMLHQHCIIAG